MKKNNRFLVDLSLKYTENAWDNCKIEGMELNMAIEKINDDHKNISRNIFLIENDYKKWEKFYKMHQNKFFKDRKWIFECFQKLKISKTIFELGCGVGNSLAILADKKISGCDFSATAVKICSERYKSSNFFIHDIKKPIKIKELYDSVLLIFTLSAIEPNNHIDVLENAFNLLERGGCFYFKDYGLFDMMQINYKKENIISENFYRRNDGTYTYFFSKEYMLNLAEKLNFKILSLNYDYRLLINRKKQKDMYRVYLLAVFEKR